MSTNKSVHTIGRRKKSTCRVYLHQGTGKVFVNKKPMETYFDTVDQRYAAIQALKVLGVEKEFDVLCFPKGGGKRGQAGAVRLGIARALKNYEALTHGAKDETSEDGEVAVLMPWHRALRDADMLTCDSRQVERKKFGLRGARKRVQYSKR